MNKPFVTLTGRLWSAAKLVTPENGAKAYVDVTVKMAPRTWNGKTYFQKVYVRCYNQTAISLIPRLQPDTLVSVVGEADAVVEQGKDGKSYANLRVLGNVSLFDGDSAPPTTTGTRSAEEYESKSPGRSNAPAERSPAPVSEGEEVPF